MAGMNLGLAIDNRINMVRILINDAKTEGIGKALENRIQLFKYSSEHLGEALDVDLGKESLFTLSENSKK
jgi:hypothetical protein